MDKRMRRHELCIIGQPRCDFVFSSNRTCFVGYGFAESTLEMTILSQLLQERGITPVEAGNALAPGQNAFCAKICSKIIQSQFCIVLLNNDSRGDVEVPNANVNMEYGLMLGFNKPVIPFQREEQRLPFNVAGLDTVKYTQQDFRDKAVKAIDETVRASVQDAVPVSPPDQSIELYLLAKGVMLVPLNTDGDRNLFELGRPLGFNMLTAFDGMSYLYFGDFRALRGEGVIWRIETLEKILTARFGAFPQRVARGWTTVDAGEVDAAKHFVEKLQIWVLVTGDDQRDALLDLHAQRQFTWPLDVSSLSDVEAFRQALT